MDNILRIICFLVILLVPIIRAQTTAGKSRHQNEHARLRCLGVRCPPERPRCITESQVTKCVAPEPIRTVSSRDNIRNNRLSRPALGFGSSRRRPSQTFQLNEAGKTIVRQNLTGVSSLPPSAVLPKTPANVPAYCHENFQTGRCRAYFPRYYYNKDTGRCHRFVYGGCGGNRNNFKSEQACKSICLEPIVNSGFNVGLEASYPKPASNGNRDTTQNPPKSNTNSGINNRPIRVNSGFAKGAPPPQPGYCEQNPERGPCFALMPRYYYNKQTGQCRSFRYGGCGGNRNNFQTMALCKRACDYFDLYTSRQSNGNNIPQGSEADIAPSDIPIESLSQVASQSQTSTPAPVNYERSPPITSGFAKDAPPPLPEYCFQSPERGPCFAMMPRFYYNKDVGQCRSFRYGGCGGNGNNFRSMDSCKSACGYVDSYRSRQSNGNNISQDQAADVFLSTDVPEINFIPVTEAPTTTESPVPDFCNLPKKVGPCRALIPRFFYNAETSRCEQFGFGGCQPNENNFKSERACKRKCITPKTFSGVKLVSGRRNNINNNERNTMQSGQLRQFNPVDSAAFREFLMSQQMKNDIDIVGPSTSGFHMCAQRMDPGTCNLKVRSYYFNASTRSCQPFIFHGCGGNQNRFSSLRACEDMCINDSLRPVRTP